MTRFFFTSLLATMLSTTTVVAQQQMFFNTNVPKKQIIEQIKAFCSAIELYSNAGEKPFEPYYSEIYNYYNSKSNNPHIDDLAFNDLLNDDANDSWSAYLGKINREYKNNIETEFSKIELLDCYNIVDDRTFYYAKTQKSLKYNGKKISVEEAIGFWIEPDNTVKIGEVVTVAYCENKGIKCTFRATSNTTDDKKNQVTDLLNLANNYFNQKNYLLAKKKYEKLKEIDKQNNFYNEQITKCDKFLNAELYENLGDSLYNVAKYEDAILAYYTITKYNLASSSERVQQKLKNCDDKINELNYSNNINYGDYYLRLRMNKQAADYFKEALKYKKNDAVALAKLEECKRIDPNYARLEIKKAESLAATSRKNWGLAFKTFFTYESSGLLTTENYYNMVMMLDERNRKVRKEMKFRFRDFQKYLNIYIVKLRKSAANESNYIMKQKVDDLLINVINKRYQ